MEREPEPEVMDDPEEAAAYGEADFSDVNRSFALSAHGLAGPRGRAIDLGTGPADIPILFCQLAPGWRVVAVDASPSMIETARKRVAAAGLIRRIRLLRGDAKKLGPGLGRFDLILSNGALHHIDDPVPFWMMVARLALPGGGVLIQDLTRPESRTAARELVKIHATGATPLLKELFYRSLLASFTPGEVRSHLRSAGLRGLRVRQRDDHHLEVKGRLK